jgi:peptidoglycan-N-acetylglucosamine deacetylase
MPPQSPESTAPGHRPRHAAAPDPGASSADGRHRRPETLADATRLRAAPATPGIRRRSAEAPSFVVHRWADDPAPAQLRRQAEAIRAARRRHERPRERPPGRGKHAGSLDLSVRPLPVVRDAVVNARDWALAPGEPPPIGTHRAPGTLPIESWLLMGRGRQQAVLATLVAVGLALVMIPIERHVDVNPIAAADRTIINTAPRHKSPGTPGRSAGKTATHAGGGTADEPPPSRPQPSATATPPAPTTPAEPAPPVPPGTGPAQSLKVTGSTAIALTFDDGPDPVQTPKILALLDKYQVKATFCLIGANVQKHPEIVRQIVAAGHTLCNHTWNHSLVIGQAPAAAIRADLERTTAAIHEAAPGAPVPFFRAPGGNFTDRLVSEAYAEGMASLYWQVDPQDWNHLPLETDAVHIERVVRTVQATVRPGSIILSHDFNQPDTIAAYERLLPYLTQRYETGVPVPPPIPEPPPAPPESSPPSAPAPDDRTGTGPPVADRPAGS